MYPATQILSKQYQKDGMLDSPLLAGTCPSTINSRRPLWSPGYARLSQDHSAVLHDQELSPPANKRPSNRMLSLVSRPEKRSIRFRRHAIASAPQPLSGGHDHHPPTPNRSATMPKHGEKKVFPIGICALPPSESVSNAFLALCSSGKSADSEKS